jgi:hypothetical protein
MFARTPRGLVALGLASIATTFAVDASARETDAALAEALFREGKALMASKKYAAACPKLAESHRLDPGSGTLLALALCHEGEGKTASAWAELNEVAAASRRDGRDDREKFARREIAKLEPLLSRLEIAVAPSIARLEGLAVTRDGIALGPAAWGSPSPVDPGPHTIVATMGTSRFATTVALQRGERRTVTIELPQAPPPSSPPPVDERDERKPTPAAIDAPAEDKPVSGTQRTIALVVGSVGVVGLGVGAVFGLLALSKNDEAEAMCKPSACENPTAFERSKTAHDFANVSNVSFAVGAVGLAVGAILLLTAPKSGASSPRASIVPVMAGDRGGLLLDGRF